MDGDMASGCGPVGGTGVFGPGAGSNCSSSGRLASSVANSMAAAAAAVSRSLATCGSWSGEGRAGRPVGSSTSDEENGCSVWLGLSALAFLLSPHWYAVSASSGMRRITGACANSCHQRQLSPRTVTSMRRGAGAHATRHVFVACPSCGYEVPEASPPANVFNSLSSGMEGGMSRGDETEPLIIPPMPQKVEREASSASAGAAVVGTSNGPCRSCGRNCTCATSSSMIRWK